MTSGAAMAARATPPDLIEDVDNRAAPRPAEAAQAPGGADAGRHPRAIPLPAGDGRRALERRDQATGPGRPAAAAERYLAPALKAAAAARARSARIRAATVEALAPRDAGPAGRALPPGPAAPPATAAGHGWSVSEKPAAAPARAPAAGRRFGGLSVAAAARAATIAFQPVRRLAPPAAPSDPPPPVDPPAPTAPRARAPDREPPPAPGPPAATDPSPEPARGSGAEAQRFARTVAELERYLAASRAREPGSDVVPRPTLPLVDQEPSARAWLRLWSRR